MTYKELQMNKKERRNTKERKLIARGIILGILISAVTVTIHNSRTPKIEDYMIVYADKNQTITSICQESYSKKTIDKIGMNTLRSNCIEEVKDDVLKIGERVLVPIYKK